MLQAIISRAPPRTRRIRRRRARRSAIWGLAGRSVRAMRAAPIAVQIVVGMVLVVAVWAAVNWIVQVARKPTEVFVAVSGSLAKTPAQTWEQYGSLFDRHSTAIITPELLAALAQVESSGNPVARTYWRWRLSLNPFAIYQPASSAVGLFQMTDAAYAEAARSCVRENAVTNTGCGFTSLTIRAIPSHAIELASVYLARNVAAVLARVPDVPASLQQKQDLAAFIHLCGGGPATAFARRNFQMMPGERCGDHLVTAYIVRVNAMKRQFKRLAADGGFQN